MDNNTMITIVFVSGSLIVLLLRLIINKSLFNFHGQENNRAENFNSNEALGVNAILTFLMFIAVLFYDGCTKDTEAVYKAKYEQMYPKVENYLRELEQKAYDKGKDDLLDKMRMQIKSVQQ